MITSEWHRLTTSTCLCFSLSRNSKYRSCIVLIRISWLTRTRWLQACSNTPASSKFRLRRTQGTGNFNSYRMLASYQLTYTNKLPIHLEESELHPWWDQDQEVFPTMYPKKLLMSYWEMTQHKIIRAVYHQSSHQSILITFNLLILILTNNRNQN